MLVSSPHAWGCFLINPRPSCSIFVFPTCVGVFLAELCLTITISGLPHMRGGVSSVTLKISVSSWSSPHAWGCFHTKMLLVTVLFGLPHMRGGVSEVRRLDNLPPLVFPTCVGVFLWSWFILAGSISLPHMRGGVSPDAVFARSNMLSSPHAWGCFLC